MPAVGNMLSNNAPITIIDAHRSIHTDSPVTAQLIQSVNLLNMLLMDMLNINPHQIPQTALNRMPFPVLLPQTSAFGGMEAPAIILGSSEGPKFEHVLAETANEAEDY